MRIRRQPAFLDRIMGVCFNTPDVSGGNPGSGDVGGGGGGAPSSDPLPNGGGQVQEPADHSAFNTTSPRAEGQAQRVTALMSKKDTDILTFDEIADIMNFNPAFGDTNGTPAATPATPQPAAPAAPAAATSPAAPQAPAQPQAQPLTAEAIAAAVRAGLQPAADPSAAPSEPKVYYGGEVPAVTVDDGLVSVLIGSQDPAQVGPAKQALNALVNGMMNRVVADQNARMGQIAALIMQSVPRQVRQEQTVNESERQFYGEFGELNRPAYKPVVDKIASIVISAKVKANPNFRLDQATINLIGEAARKQIERDYGVVPPRAKQVVTQQQQPGPRPQQTQPAPVTREPFASRGGGARPPVADPNNQSADLLSLV